MKAQIKSQKSEVSAPGWSLLTLAATGMLGATLLLPAGCTSMDRAYTKQVTWTNAPVVQVVTNTLIATNTVAQIIERTNIVLVTNQNTGAVSGVATREPVATNFVTLLVTNTIPVFSTNLVQVPVTNLVAKPEAEATIQAAGSIVNTFLPGIGSILALALGGVYHGYRQVRNRKVNEALIQGVETARAVLETTPQGQAADAQFVHWLMEHQKEAGVFTTISSLVDSLSDNPAAKLTAQEILERIQRAQQPRATSPLAAVVS
ncbi:MAG: hypothetical protein HZA90_18990 [Verrucomicrobia bacterium]|nr:hypothetical protein [Verrucomicrobiota bacterium]